MSLTIRLALGLVASVGLASVAWRLHALTGKGAVAAAVVGTLILSGTGVPGGAALLTFFLGSSVVSRISPDPAATQFGAKGSRRDQWQVLANGGPAAVGALLGPESGLWAVTVSLAVAAADTWATSIGAWSRTPPRHLLTGAAVPPGTSGGITLIGTVGALAGAAAVAGAAALASGRPALVPFGCLVGLLGMLADSAVGASLQGKFRCEKCAEDTERSVHRCGSPSIPRGGLAWLTNDGVNLIATGLGAAFVAAGWHWLASR